MEFQVHLCLNILKNIIKLNKGNYKVSIIYIADIEQDIDDKIAIEYLHRMSVLKGVVLDNPSDSPRIDELKEM